LASVQSRPGRAGNRRGLSTAAAALSVNTSCGSTDSDSKTLPTLAGEPTASSRRTDGQPRWKTRAECVAPRRINGQAFQGTFASICTVYGRRRTNSVDRHLPCPGRDASPAMRPRARALQWVSNIKMRRMLLACFWCRITLWSSPRKPPSLSCAKRGRVEVVSWFGTAGKQNMGACCSSATRDESMYHRSSSDELLAPSGELGIDEYELFSGRRQAAGFPPLPCLEAPRSVTDSWCVD
jgi:hypothetical protein